MKTRPMHKHEYPIVLDWFKEQTGQELASVLLSDYGLIAESENMLVAAIFLFPVMGADIAFIGWPIANPSSAKTVRDVALDELIIKGEQNLKTMGYNYITTYASRKSVEARFKKHDYFEADKNVLQLIKGV